MAALISPSPTRRRLLWLLLVAVLLLIVIALGGPRPAEVNLDQAHSQRVGEDYQHWLQQRDLRTSSLRVELGSKIVWRQGEGQKTQRVLLFLHGFSASPQELSPLPEKLAELLQANLLSYRLSGHGALGANLTRAQAQEWVQDAIDATQVAGHLGEEIYLLGSSTGGTLAAWLAWSAARHAASGQASVVSDTISPLQVQRFPKISALAVLSPNFGVPDPLAFVATWPWGIWAVKKLRGPDHVWQSSNPLVQARWTTRFGLEAAGQMLRLVETARELPWEQAQVPLLTLLSPVDTVISLTEAQRFTERWGGPKHWELLPEAKHHVLAGDAVSPETTDLVLGKVYEHFRRF